MSLETRKLCKCGCGHTTAIGKAFLSGHDQIAIHRIIRDCYGTVEKFVDQHEGH